MGRTRIALTLVTALTLGLFSGCTDGKASSGSGKSTTTTPTGKTDVVSTATSEPDEPVTLTIAGSWNDCRAVEETGRAFKAVYPNCTVEYEYLQDYYASVVKRMSGEAQVDLFFTTNIQADSELLPYALDLKSCEGLDLSNTFDGLIENFTYFGDDSEALYSIPLGAEMRGLYVNKTLLDSLQIAVPTDQASLLAACAKLKENGYTPFHGNPGLFAQTLMYPWVCNLIANADDPVAAHRRVDQREAGMEEMFREPYEFLYTLVEQNYYDYKRAQTDQNLFVESTDIDYARYFLNIQKNGESFEKKDDLGQIAFMPSPLSLKGVIDKAKDDYHSEIEYIFIPAPVGKEGGYVYLSPAHGIAANKNSADKEWSVKFLNFLFTPENNEAFSKSFNIIPNTEEAFAYVTSLYAVPNDHISELGQVTFSYSFYNAMVETLTDVSKANNPKYMQENADGSTSLYPLSYYMDKLRERVAAQ